MENIKITFLIAADCERSARKIASENAIVEKHKDFWLKLKKEKMMIFSSIALILKKTCGASCKKIGIADKSIAQGILLTLKQQIV